MNASFFIRKRLINYGFHAINLFPDSLLLKNKKFKNRHQGNRCFILGSGHSIATQDLSKLTGEIIITQNHFFVHKDTSIFHPAYHVVIPKFHPAEYDQDWVDWIADMEKVALQAHGVCPQHRLSYAPVESLWFRLVGQM